MLSKLIGHKNTKQILVNILKSGKYANAYIFNGPRGVGKYTAAMQFAIAVCGEKYRNEIESYRFPDILSVYPALKKNLSSNGSLIASMTENLSKYEAYRRGDSKNKADNPFSISGNETISIDAVREIIGYVSSKTYVSEKRVVIVKNADMMRKEGANSFLKILEEPPANTLFILTADNPNFILPTIVSRCQSIKFSYLRSEEIRDYLLAQKYEGGIEDAVWFLDGSLENLSILLKSKINISRERIIKDFVEYDISDIESYFTEFDKKGYDGFFLKFFIRTVSKIISEALNETGEEHSLLKYRIALAEKFTKDELFKLAGGISGLEGDSRINIGADYIIRHIMNLTAITREA